MVYFTEADLRAAFAEHNQRPSRSNGMILLSAFDKHLVYNVSHEKMWRAMFQIVIFSKKNSYTNKKNINNIS